MSQTLLKARQLATSADTSERQAEAYNLIAGAIQDLDIDEWIKREEVVRYNALANEFYEDADELRGQVDSELIDRL